MQKRKRTVYVPYLFSAQQHQETHRFRVVVRKSQGGRVAYVTPDTFTNDTDAYANAFSWAETQGFDLSHFRQEKGVA